MVEAPDGDPLRSQPLLSSLAARQASGGATGGRSRARRVLAAADVVIDTPGCGAWRSTRRAPRTVWVSSLRSAAWGPAPGWRAPDLGVHGGEREHVRDRRPRSPPVRCSRWRTPTPAPRSPSPRSALASGRPQRIDMSMQEVVLVSNMGAAGRFPATAIGAASGREHRSHPRDLAVQRRLGLVRPAGRAGASRASRLMSSGWPRRAATPALEHATGRRSPTTKPPTTSCAPSRSRSPSSSPATPPPSCTRSPASRTSCSPPSTPREIHASAQLGGAGCSARWAVSSRFPLSFAQVRDPDGGRPDPPEAPSPRPRQRPPPTWGSGERRAPTAREGATGRGRARRSSSSGRGRPGRSPPATSPSTAPPCCGRVEAGPTSCACMPLGPRQPARARDVDDVRRPERRQAQRHDQPQEPRGVELARRLRRVGRRRRRELRSRP